MKRDESAGNGTAAVPDVVRRAAAILAHQAPLRSAFPAFDRAVSTGAGYPAPLPPMTSFDELRERALKLVSDFFASFGPGAAWMPALLAALSSGHGGSTFPAEEAAVPAGTAAFPDPASIASTMSTLIWHSAPSTTRAGQSVKVPLQAESRQNQPIQVGYYSTDLLSDSGCTIPSYQVSFEPPNFTLRPGERTPVSARVEVPIQSIPGAYSGLVQAAGLPDSKAVITIHVV